MARRIVIREGRVVEGLKPHKGSKMETIYKLLHRKEGATAKEIREALGWESVSIPQRAKQLGIKTRKETRYWAV